MSFLPLDCWKLIVKYVVSDLEYGWVRGPSVILRDICNLSSTCRCLSNYHANFLGILSCQFGDNIDWVKITRQPQHCTINDLRTGLRYLKDVFWGSGHKFRISVSKPNLIHQIRGISSINECAVPANICAAVSHEKRIKSGCEIERIVHKLAYVQHTDWRAAAILSELSRHTRPSLFHVRLQCVRHFPNMQSLTAVAWPPSGHKMPTFDWGGSSGETMQQYLGRLKDEDKRLLV